MTHELAAREPEVDEDRGAALGVGRRRVQPAGGQVQLAAVEQGEALLRALPISCEVSIEASTWAIASSGRPVIPSSQAIM